MTLTQVMGQLRHHLAPDNIRDHLMGLPKWPAALVLFSLGLFSGLSASPIHFFPALAFGLTGLVWALDGSMQTDRPGRSGFWRAFFFAWAYLGIGVFWVAFAFWNRGGAFVFFGPLVAVFGAAFLAAFWGLAGAAYARLKLSGPVRVIALAVLLLAAEAAKGLPFTQFSWNLPAHIFPAGGAVSQSAAWFGVWGLSFLTLLMFTSPATLAGPGHETHKRLPVLISLLVLASLYAGGTQRLMRAQDGYQPDLVFRMVTVDVDQQVKWGPGGEDLMRRRYLELTAAEGVENVTHVIWPEGALPLFLLEDGPAIAALTEILNRDQVLLAGTPRRERHEGNETRYYNSLIAISFDEDRPRVRGLYDKVYLVPFGEYVPLSGLVASLGVSSLQELVAGYSPGSEIVVMDNTGAPAFTPLICYEVVFSGLVPQGADRPDWILNISNDAWFGPTAGPRQHLNITRFQAIETGLPVIRVASRGYSGTIDAYGRMPVRVDRRYEGATDVRLPSPAARTLYTMTSGLFFWAFYILSILIISAIVIQRQMRR
ncbi:apolipoprotein N-acyltransferase [Hyphobacterium sp. HN65]|uniref:Apolipoprotein N-acyltransferase n=1 Tax=Hyphobacterium lacteum TaxID=3116575 RepID=A0ABU7LTM1_9PROT|nr:apolipoprotein N-acyltransferase [Hyphobacterium sp. HN65]MEE2526694.1 apolipoprotein N-acyltransferase [Hyphobacterium sp. HN65]